LRDAHAIPDRHTLMQALTRYRTSDRARSIMEIAITIIPLVLLWLLMWRSLEIGFGACLLLAVPAAGFLVRLFMIQHDCGHGAFFRRRQSNDWVGRAIGVLTLTPYDFWRHNYAPSHGT
jgi:omega-6 fatty acid desaturase (delta-12 desaturase)